MIQSAFLWGYTGTQILGGSLADQYGGKIVIARGILVFSLASLMFPLAFSPLVQSLGIMMPLVLLSRIFVVSSLFGDNQNKRELYIKHLAQEYCLH